MTNISVSNLESKDYQLAYQKLNDLIASLNRRNAHYLIDELLTEAERIMLTKRFAAALLYANHYSSYRVSTILGVSISTAQRIKAQSDDGMFAHLVSTVPKKQRLAFLQLIEDLIVAKASPRARARLFNAAANHRR